ncbi:MAG: hypothetical protein K8L99_27060 [Anaerolineae bacterium]|nr:hypothetical protein [Anaerolineae bacterium]
MTFQDFPAINLPAPLLALHATPDGLWVGGTGGVAHYANGQWTPHIAGLPLTVIGGLATAEGWLFAGGMEGIARSADGGENWQLATVHGSASGIASIITSPNFAQDTAALAATLEGGILRSEDAGNTWTASNFGLSDFEVSALVWLAEDVVVAGTSGGIYRSPNGGRAWRAVDGTSEPVAALAQLADGRLLAALENGGLLVSDDQSANWTPLESDLLRDLPEDAQLTALCVAGDGSLLMGTSSDGIYRSVDGGVQWHRTHEAGAFALAADRAGTMVYAGTGIGLLVSENSGQHFEQAPASPLHDLRQLLIYQGNPLVYGRYSGALYYEAGWLPVEDLAPPLSLLMIAPDGHLYASGMDGLRVLTEAGWIALAEGQAGYFAQMAFRKDGMVWACSHNYSHLFRSPDGGRTWETSPTPFGVLPLVALEATDTLVFAMTFDPRQNLARLWRSSDAGVNWQRGAEVRTPWPVVATCSEPAIIGIGTMMIVEQPNGDWNRAEVDGLSSFLVRKIVSMGDVLLALTTEGLLRSEDGGNSWTLVDADQFDIGSEVIMDIAVDVQNPGDLYVLMVGGQVRAYRL